MSDWLSSHSPGCSQLLNLSSWKAWSVSKITECESYVTLLNSVWCLQHKAITVHVHLITVTLFQILPEYRSSDWQRSHTHSFGCRTERIALAMRNGVNCSTESEIYAEFVLEISETFSFIFLAGFITCYIELVTSWYVVSCHVIVMFHRSDLSGREKLSVARMPLSYCRDSNREF